MVRFDQSRKGPRRERQTKRWKSIFFNRRRFEDIPFFKARENIESFEREGGPLDAFLEDTESSTPSWERIVIKNFLQAQTSRATPAPTLARARLDDREHGSGEIRKNSEWLTPSQLRHALDFQRFGSPELPNADRRLIYIHRLTPEYALVLIETVLSHQADALRDTIWKYLAFEASIRVTLPLFPIFVLEFHLPFLSLRETSGSANDSVNSEDGHTERVEFDVSFLTLQCTQHNSHEGICKHLIHESQVTVVICGWNHHNWVGWGLFNTPSNPTEEFEDPDQEQYLKEDYFAADGDDGIVIDANNPKCDPREYWLCIIEIRVQIVLKEWKWLVRNIEAGVTAWKKKHPVLLEIRTEDGNYHNIKELFGWTTQTMQLIRQVRERFARTTQAWNLFVSSNGDVRYFSDMRNQESLLALNSLKVSFQELTDLQRKLVLLDKSCKESKEILSLCLERENNRVHSIIQELNRHAHDLNLETNIISRDVHGLNRKGTEAAIATVQAAQDTNRATRVNFLMMWITTPLVIALQYFGGEKDIFSFERNTKSFFLAILILIFALPSLTYSLDILVGLLVTRLRTKSKNSDNEANCSGNFVTQSQFVTTVGA